MKITKLTGELKVLLAAYGLVLLLAFGLGVYGMGYSIFGEYSKYSGAYFYLGAVVTGVASLKIYYFLRGVKNYVIFRIQQREPVASRGNHFI